VGDQKKYLGYIDQESLKGKSAQSLETYIQPDENVITRNMYLSEALKVMSDSLYDVAVLDQMGQLRGALTSDEIITALSE
jgi:Mg/Co/Ni transporter MgtE